MNKPNTNNEERSKECCNMCYLLDNEYNVVCTNSFCYCHSTPALDKEECIRCGLPKNEWKGRWQEPLCKVGETTYDLHISSKETEKLTDNQFDSSKILKNELIEKIEEVARTLWRNQEFESEIEAEKGLKAFIFKIEELTIAETKRKTVKKVEKYRDNLLSTTLTGEGVSIFDDIINLLEDNKK